MELSNEMVEQLLIKAVAAAMAAKKTKSTKERKPRAPKTEEQKLADRSKVDAETVVNFAAKGFKDVNPRVDVKNYDRWLEAGRQVRKGEKSTKCGRWPLFHISQTDPITAQH